MRQRHEPLPEGIERDDLNWQLRSDCAFDETPSLLIVTGNVNALPEDAVQKADSTAISLPGKVRAGWGVSEAVEGFVTSLAVVTWLGL